MRSRCECPIVCVASQRVNVEVCRRSSYFRSIIGGAITLLLRARCQKYQTLVHCAHAINHIATQWVGTLSPIYNETNTREHFTLVRCAKYAARHFGAIEWWVRRTYVCCSLCSRVRTRWRRATDKMTIRCIQLNARYSRVYLIWQCQWKYI